MDAFLTSLAAVAIAEIGDKTQLLAIMLAARFGRPLPIMAGILAATIANHAAAAWLGAEAGAFLDSRAFAYVVGASFIAMAVWALIPDKDSEVAARGAYGPFVTTLVAFFLIEIGDKTQVATIALAARFQDVASVTLGTTLGMMAANVPAVYLGRALLERIPLKTIRWITAALFAAMGAYVIVERLAV